LALAAESSKAYMTNLRAGNQQRQRRPAAKLIQDALGIENDDVVKSKDEYGS
jgi:hypothetical protein